MVPADFARELERDLAAAQALMNATGIAKLQADLAAAQGARQAAEAEASMWQNSFHAMAERAQAAEARAESYKAVIDRARRVMAGEGVEDQAQAWDQCLRILDAAIAGEPK